MYLSHPDKDVLSFTTIKKVIGKTVNTVLLHTDEMLLKV